MAQDWTHYVFTDESYGREYLGVLAGGDLVSNVASEFSYLQSNLVPDLVYVFVVGTLELPRHAPDPDVQKVCL